MNFKKRINDSWVDTPNYIHKTDTDTFTTLPADIFPNAATATVGLKGQTVQNGTPTSQNPVMPNGTGERTGNLFDKSKKTDSSRVIYTTGEIGALSGVFVSDFTPIEPNTTYTLNIVSSISGKTSHLFALYDENKNFVNTGAHETSLATVYIFTTPSNVAYIRFNGNMASVDEIMLNLGSTALPYEPFGVKIPISSASTTTPVYLGEVETERKIKKLVFDGTENWKKSGAYAGSFYFEGGAADAINTEYEAFCSHVLFTTISSYARNKFCFNGSPINLNLWFSQFGASTTVDDFKTYLAQQYANGTPVTVWYVLAEPTTGIVNEPLRKIGDYADEVSGIIIPTIAGADTISVDTTLQPSEVTVNYKGWHPVQNVHERDNGAWT